MVLTEELLKTCVFYNRRLVWVHIWNDCLVGIARADRVRERMVIWLREQLYNPHIPITMNIDVCVFMEWHMANCLLAAI